MATLPESAIFEEGIFQLEKSTPPLGGAPVFSGSTPTAGHANAQAMQLANRTQWLKAQIDSKSTTPLLNYEALRFYRGDAEVIHIIGSGIEGFFVKESVSTPTDNGGTVIVDALGRAWVRVYQGDVYPEWFGAVGDGVANDTPAFQKAINYTRTLGGGTVSFRSRYLIDQNLYIEDYVSLVGGIDLPDEVLDGVRNYDAKHSQLIVNPSVTITVRSGSSVSRCIILRKGLDLPFQDAEKAAIGLGEFSGTAFTVGGAGAYFHHMLVLGFDKAIYSSNCERIRCEYVQGDCLNGIDLRAVYDVAYIENCHFWPFTTTHQSWTTGALNKRPGIAYKFANVGDWSKITNCFSYSYERGYVVDSCDNVNIIGCGADHYGPDTNTSSIGFEFTGSSKNGLLLGCQSAAQWRAVSVNTNSTISGDVRIVASNFWDNDDCDIAIIKGRVVVSGTSSRNSPYGVYAYEGSGGGVVSSSVFDSNQIAPIGGPARHKIEESSCQYVNTGEADVPLISDRIFIFSDQILPIFAKNLFLNKEDKDGNFVTLSSLGTNEAFTSSLQESDEFIPLDGSKVNYSSTSGRSFLTTRKRFHEVDIRHRKPITITRVTPTCTGTGTASYSIIGDSNINRQFSAIVDAKLRARGFNPQFIGTINGTGLLDTTTTGTGGPLGEGREGWKTTDFTYRSTAFPPVAVGSEAAYNAMTKAQKVGYNPFIRPSTGADSFNGYVFDYQFYLNRFGLSTPNVVGIGLGGNNILESGTADEIADRYIADLDIMVRSIRAVSTSIDICLFLRGVSKTEDQDGKWIKHRELQKRLITYKKNSSDSRLYLISSWVHMSQEVGWDVTGAEDAYGVTNGPIGDNVHPTRGGENRNLYAETFVPFAAWTTYRLNNGFLNQGIPLQLGGKTAGVFELLGTNTVPSVQQSGGVGYEAAQAISRVVNNQSGAYHVLGKARGTETLPSDVQSGDTLGTWMGAGFVDGIYQSGSGIISYVDGTPTSGLRMPSALRFSVVQGSGTRVDAFRVRGDGNIEAGVDNSRSLGVSGFRWSNTYSVNIRPGAGTVIWTSGAGTPEGSVSAVPGSMYTRTDGGTGTTLYVKESGTGNTGWVAK